MKDFRSIGFHKLGIEAFKSRCESTYQWFTASIKMLEYETVGPKGQIIHLSYGFIPADEYLIGSFGEEIPQRRTIESTEINVHQGH